MTYVFQRGATIALALDIVAGDGGQVSAVTAALKPVAAGRSTADPATPVAGTFTVAARAATIDYPAGWTLSITPVASGALALGRYLADARIVTGSVVSVTDAVAIQIVEPVTAS